jgi:ankyrin repeat protein
MGAHLGAEGILSQFLNESVWMGTLERAREILAAHPEVAGSSIYVAAVLGDDSGVRRFLEMDRASATAKGGPRGWDALTYLCFSKYLRLETQRADGFVRAAEALLDAGADPNTGFEARDHQPNPEFESVLYGAAGVAHNASLTRLLIERGADPNDDEATYHSPEGYDNGAMQALAGSGRITSESLTTMLLRKHDWHDYEGVVWLLERGADPNRMTRWHRTPFQHALLRDNALPIVEAALDHGAKPVLGLAARRGRGDVLELYERRGVRVELQGVERLIAACARGWDEEVRSIAQAEPRLVAEVVEQGGKLLAEFAGNGNADGVRLLLDLGVDAGAEFREGDGYWDVAERSTALHVAAWRVWHGAAKVLIERGAPVEAKDGKGRTPLDLAVKAGVDSYWKDARPAGEVVALLRAASG